MRDPKYELTGSFIFHHNRKLFRIRALRNFGDVKAGDLGGWIQSEDNLSHHGFCWVYDEAKVFDNATVIKNAKIYDNAEVFDRARISGNASIHDEAEIFTHARVSGEARIYSNAQVCGEAAVYGRAQLLMHARVYGSAEVFGNAVIYDRVQVHRDAKVFGSARIYGDVEIREQAEVYGNTIIYGNITILRDADIKSSRDLFSASYVGSEFGTLTVFKAKTGIIVTRGCYVGTPEDFMRCSKRDHGFGSVIYNEYKTLIELAVNRITRGKS